jgi:drug/metabolite transporter (DMT)-like permease
MADNGENKKDVSKWTYIALIFAGVMIIGNGIVQLNIGDQTLGIASLVVGAATLAFGILKRGKIK